MQERKEKLILLHNGKDRLYFKNRQGNLLFRVRFVNILNIYTRPKKGMNVAISKAMRAALAILSYRDIDIKKNYPLAREFERIKSWRLKNLNFIVFGNIRYAAADMMYRLEYSPKKKCI